VRDVHVAVPLIVAQIRERAREFMPAINYVCRHGAVYFYRRDFRDHWLISSS
jgi:hypothetical protein